MSDKIYETVLISRLKRVFTPVDMAVVHFPTASDMIT